jgi:hypothetical protein
MHPDEAHVRVLVQPVLAEVCGEQGVVRRWAVGGFAVMVWGLEIWCLDVWLAYEDTGF